MLPVQPPVSLTACETLEEREGKVGGVGRHTERGWKGRQREVEGRGARKGGEGGGWEGRQRGWRGEERGESGGGERREAGGRTSIYKNTVLDQEMGSLLSGLLVSIVSAGQAVP